MDVQGHETANHNKRLLIMHHAEAISEIGIKTIHEFLLTNGIVVVDTTPNNKHSSRKHSKKRKEIVDKTKTKIREVFSDYDVINGPQVVGHRRDGMKSHPFLSEVCSDTLLIRKIGLQHEKMRLPGIFGDYSTVYLNYLYASILNKHRNSWVILGDETGTLLEFSGKNPSNHRAAMSWIIVPPYCDLPALIQISTSLRMQNKCFPR